MMRWYNDYWITEHFSNGTTVSWKYFADDCTHTVGPVPLDYYRKRPWRYIVTQLLEGEDLGWFKVAHMTKEFMRAHTVMPDFNKLLGGQSVDYGETDTVSVDISEDSEGKCEAHTEVD